MPAGMYLRQNRQGQGIGRGGKPTQTGGRGERHRPAPTDAGKLPCQPGGTARVLEVEKLLLLPLQVLARNRHLLPAILEPVGKAHLEHCLPDLVERSILVKTNRPVEQECKDGGEQYQSAQAVIPAGRGAVKVPHCHQDQPGRAQGIAGHDIGKPMGAEIEAGETNGGGKENGQGTRQPAPAGFQLATAEQGEKTIHHHGHGGVAAGKGPLHDPLVELCGPWYPGHVLDHVDQQKPTHGGTAKKTGRITGSPPHQPTATDHHHNNQQGCVASHGGRDHQGVTPGRAQPLEQVVEIVVHEDQGVAVENVPGDSQKEPAAAQEEDNEQEQGAEQGHFPEQEAAQPAVEQG